LRLLLRGYPVIGIREQKCAVAFDDVQQKQFGITTRLRRDAFK